jgi:hypothetical protein
MAIKKPNRSVLEPGAKDALLDILLGFYDALSELSGTRTPATIPALQAITVTTHVMLRKVVGDPNAIIGPRSVLVSGRNLPLDGGGGVFVWVPGNIAVDDDTTVIQPSAIGLNKPGRWLRAVTW